jgi:hypothetical protein
LFGILLLPIAPIFLSLEHITTITASPSHISFCVGLQSTYMLPTTLCPRELSQQGHLQARLGSSSLLTIEIFLSHLTFFSCIRLPYERKCQATTELLLCLGSFAFQAVDLRPQRSACCKASVSTHSAETQTERRYPTRNHRRAARGSQPQDMSPLFRPLGLVWIPPSRDSVIADSFEDQVSLFLHRC